MTMTDTPAAPAPKAKRPKRANRRRPAAAPKSATVPKEFEGMTITACCAACKAERCIISGKPYCAHPAKGGLHPPDMMNPEAVQRQERAKYQLGEAKLNL